MPESADGLALGFDYGLRRIGVAIGQRLTNTASPLTIVDARDGKPDWAAITRLIDSWQPQVLVVGMPLHMDGSEQEMTARARRFGNQLAGRYNLPVHHADERLTSYVAEQERREQDRKQKPGRHQGRNGGPLDAVAAQHILQGWLDGRMQ